MLFRSGDGFADLAAGASGEDVNGVRDAGAVSVLYGSAGGLTGTGSQFFPQVGGAVEGLAALRERVLVPPLERPITHAFVPHVTVADDMEPARIPAAVAALADYVVDVRVDTVHLLEEGRGRVWRPIAEVGLTRRWVPGQVKRTIG